ncbi:MAG: hypothetical protein WC369_07100 [Dehalococcoidales bacterium]
MINSLLTEIKNEYESASLKYPAFHSTHEGYAVLKEEVDELWDGVKDNEGIMGNEALRKEAIQIAAMALRFIEDLC